MDIQIEGKNVQIKSNSLKISDALTKRPTCSFVVVDMNATQSYEKGMPVDIYDIGGSRIFGGYINTPAEKVMRPPNTGLFHTITADGYTFIPDRLIAAESYVGQTAGYIVTDLFNKYLAAEDITLGTVGTGATVHNAVVNYAYVSQALDKLATISQYIWFITNDKVLHFQARDATPSPFNIDGMVALAGTVSVKKRNDHYRNRQYIRGGVNTTSSQTETFIGDGTSTTFTAGFPIATVPTITVGGVAQTVGIKGVDTGKDWYWNKGQSTITMDNSSTPVANGVQIVLDYQGLYDIIVLTSDESAIINKQTIEGGGTGRVDDIFDDPNTADSTSAFQSANALLQRYSTTGKTLYFKTTQKGLRAGMITYSTFPIYGMNNLEMLITQVTASDNQNTIIYDVQAIEGPVYDSWQKWIAQRMSRPEVWVDKVNIGEQKTLIILVQQSYTWTWTQNATVTPIACPVPAATLYPSSTLYPC